MARLDGGDALDDELRGSFDLRADHRVCCTLTARNPQHVQPRLQEQGTDDNDDDIDQDDIYSANHW